MGGKISKKVHPRIRRRKRAGNVRTDAQGRMRLVDPDMPTPKRRRAK